LDDYAWFEKTISRVIGEEFEADESLAGVVKQTVFFGDFMRYTLLKVRGLIWQFAMFMQG